jgi:hypothetical protein
VKPRPGGAALVLLALAAAVAPQASSPIVSRTELFPAEPSVNAERGFAIAYDGDWLAVGARLDDAAGSDAGAVHLFQWDGEVWLERKKLVPADLAPGEQFGTSLALSDGTLAVGAIGQERDGARPPGTVYLFTEDDGDWSEGERLPAPAGVSRFGRSLALDGGRLAVGALEGRDAESGVVHLFSAGAGGWTAEAVLRPPRRRSVEQDRFGESLALRGGLLAVGAPGDDTVGQNAGAVYVFAISPEADWKTDRLLAPGCGNDGPAGDQFGASVAVSEGILVVGAASAGADRAGAAYVLERSGSSWRSLELSPRSRSPRARFGHAVAMDGDRLAVGAPFASAGALDRSGAVHVFQRDGTAWTEVHGPGLTADNTEALDLFGFAVAVRADRVVAAASLGDQGGNAAGAAHTFRCSALGCTQEAEVVASAEESTTLFGSGVDVSEDTLVVGALGGNPAAPDGAVYVYRPAGRGWRQQTKLVSPVEESGDAFGAALAVEGNILVVGAPLADRQAIVSPPFPAVVDAGAIYIFRRERDGWVRAARGTVRNPSANLQAGSAVAVGADGRIVVGVPKARPGVVFVLKPAGETWEEEQQLSADGPDLDDGFGASVAIDGDTLAVGAPSAQGGRGKVYVFRRNGSRGTWESLPAREAAALGGNSPGDRFGAAVALSGNALAVAAPGQGPGGVVHVFRRDGASWISEGDLTAGGASDQDFGMALDLDGDALVVAAVEVDEELEEAVASRASLFQRSGGAWVPMALPVEVTAEPAVEAALVDVAIHGRTFALTAPGKGLGDRVGVFRFTGGEGPP